MYTHRDIHAHTHNSIARYTQTHTHIACSWHMQTKHTRTSMYTHTETYSYIYTHKHIHVYIHTQIHLYTHKHICVHTHKHMHVHTHISIPMHTHTRISKFTYTNTQHIQVHIYTKGKGVLSLRQMQLNMPIIPATEKVEVGGLQVQDQLEQYNVGGFISKKAGRLM